MQKRSYMKGFYTNREASYSFQQVTITSQYLFSLITIKKGNLNA